MTFTPTPEQDAILCAVRDTDTSILIRAYAGTGKTSTLELVANATRRDVPGLALAFNVKIKCEMEKRFPPNFTVLTLNGLGHRAWAKATGKRLTLDDRKLGRLITTTAKEAHIDLSTEAWDSARRLTGLAQHRGLIPQGAPQGFPLLPDDQDSWQDLCDELFIDRADLIDLARATLLASIRESYVGIINYDDQIYMSTCFGGVFPRFPLVLVDESQDLSSLNHIQVKRTAAGRLIVVGDERQAIYAFRGADHASMAKLRALRPAWIELPLATTFRCPTSVVARQQEHAPGYTAFHTNAEGSVTTWPDEWNGRRLLTECSQPAVLCRNNAPLLSLAFKLVREGVGCYMIGRDIGKGLEALAKKLCPLDDTPAATAAKLITEWYLHEVDLAEANNKPAKAEAAEDRAQCLLAVLSGGARNAGELRRNLAALFSRDTGAVTLSTGHRAKGLEWHTVLHLDPWRIPSRYARGSAIQQEKNLLYVIETRAQSKLIMANLDNYQTQMED